MRKKNSKPPQLAVWLLGQSLPRYERDFVLGDFEEIYNDIRGESGLVKAVIWYWLQLFRSIPRFIHNFVYWRIAMLSNYIKVALRNLLRHKGYSLINILGLVAGLACCIFILLFVMFELSYDKYHADVDRIYLVGLSRTSGSGHEYTTANMPLLAPTLKERFPDVEQTGRVFSGSTVQITHGDKVFKEKELWHASPEILQILSISFKHGNPESALNRPNQAILTEEMALKYFGSMNPMGETIKIATREYEITGVVQNPPLNTEFPYEIIMSWKTIENDEFHQGWHPGMLATLCFIKLQPEVDAQGFERLISELPHEYAGEELEKRGMVYRNFLRPIDDLHLTSLSGGVKQPSTSLKYVYIFSIAGLLVLLIACMNFMNLATARSANRSGEIGVRKVVGAQRKQLINQFISESIFISLVSLSVAIVFVGMILPFFNALAQTQFTVSSILQPEILLELTGLVLFVGIVAGSYPAFFLSGFRPISILRGSLKIGTRGTVMRRSLVVFQFAISIALVIASMIVFRQINYMKNQPLGFDKEQKMVIVLKDWRMITEKYESVKIEFLKHPSILGASASSGVPGSFINRTWVFPADKEREEGEALRSLRCDHDFIEIYDIDLAAGRSFKKDIPTDIHDAYIINEAGVKAFGWSSPQEAVGQLMGTNGRPIVGVTRNFHWWGLQREIEPMIMRVVPSLLRSITFKVETANIKETLAFVEQKYSELFPGDLFEYFFVDSNFERQYLFEEKVGKVFRIFTALGLFIACLGLIGLASFIAEQRTKEIGIRKVLGAPVRGIIVLLTKEFVRWVLIANIIAWPFAYFAGQQWLQNFAYRINIGWTSFVLAAIVALIVAALTVSFQAFKAATANPVDALKYE